jgi:hypothetical protein
MKTGKKTNNNGTFLPEIASSPGGVQDAAGIHCAIGIIMA